MFTVIIRNNLSPSPHNSGWGAGHQCWTLFTKCNETVSAIKLLAPVGNSGHALLSFTFGLHGAHEPTRTRTKLCYNERMKDAVVEASALLDWNDAPFCP